MARLSKIELNNEYDKVMKTYNRYLKQGKQEEAQAYMDKAAPVLKYLHNELSIYEIEEKRENIINEHNQEYGNDLNKTDEFWAFYPQKEINMLDNRINSLKKENKTLLEMLNNDKCVENVDRCF